MLDSDILVLPSAAEGLPVSVLEALSAGKIVLCSRVGSLPEFLTSNLNCFFLETTTVDSISEGLNRISKFSSKPELIEIMRNARVVWENHFDVKKTTVELIHIWETISSVELK